MKRGKKWIALFVLITFLVSLFPSAALAETGEPPGEIRLFAKDADGHPVSGVSFFIRNEQGAVAGVFKTGTDGSAVSEKLPQGSYLVYELMVPEGYLPKADAVKVTVRAGAVAPVSVCLEKKEGLVIYATDEQGYPMEGISYRIRNAQNGRDVCRVQTDAQGSAAVSDLEEGTYEVSEPVVPAGYQVMTPTRQVVLRQGAGAQPVYFSHLAEGIIRMETADRADGTALGGAVYQILRNDGTFVGNFPTDANGEAHSGALKTGTYLVKQTVAPEGYFLNTTTQTLQVRAGQTGLAKFFNTKGARLQIGCLEAGKSFGLAGVGLSLFNEAGNEVMHGVTASDGFLVSPVLKPGCYALKVLEIPKGYSPIQKEQSVQIGVGERHSVKLEFVKQTRIGIHLTDEAHPDRGLAGSRFSVTSMDGTQREEVVTDAAGRAYTGPLPAGYYLIRQKEAPKGYLHTASYYWKHLTEEADAVVDVCARAKSGILIRATDRKEQPLSGAVFEICSETGGFSETLTTDQSGTAESSYLEAGSYLIKELRAPKGYAGTIPYRKFVTDGSDTQTFTFFQEKLGSLNILLTDSRTKEPLSGALFRIRDGKGNPIAEETTDEAGRIHLGELPADTYRVEQLRAPEGYEIGEGYRSVKVTHDCEKTVLFSDSMHSAVLLHALSKEGENLFGAAFSLYDRKGQLVGSAVTDETGTAVIPLLKHGVYLVKEVREPKGYTALGKTDRILLFRDSLEVLEFYHEKQGSLRIEKTDSVTGKPLAHAVFRLDEADGTCVGRAETGADGQIVFPALKSGTYHVTETGAPEGYLLDSRMRSVSVKNGAETVLSVENDPQKGFVLKNVVREDGAALEGSVFRIRNASGKTVGDYTTDRSGMLQVPLAPGNYTVVQLRVADGVEPNRESWNVTVKGKTGVFLLVENHRRSGIRIHFTDALTGRDLSGAEIRLKDENRNPVDRFRSDGEGMIYLQGVLAEGTYRAELTGVPEGYAMDREEKTVSVKPGKTAELSWKLYPLRGMIQIRTFAGEDSKWRNIRRGTELFGAVYEITDRFGRVVSETADGTDGACSLPLAPGVYTVKQIQAPDGFQRNESRVTVRVTASNRPVRIRVYNRAAGYETAVSLHGSRFVLPGGQVKYYVNLSNQSTAPVHRFFLHWKIPTDAIRCTTLYTGTYGGPATALDVYYKTNRADYRKLATGLNSRVSYSYGLSARALGLESGEYVTDIRMVFDRVEPGFQNTFAPVLSCYALSGLYPGYGVLMRAETGGLRADASANGSSAWIPGGADTFQSVVAGGSFGRYPGTLPGRLPAMGY